MQKMENLVKSDGGFIENPNRIEVSKMYQIALASHDNNNINRIKALSVILQTLWDIPKPNFDRQQTERDE